MQLTNLCVLNWNWFLWLNWEFGWDIFLGIITWRVNHQDQLFYEHSKIAWYDSISLCTSLSRHFPIPLDPVLLYYGADLIHQISDLGLNVESNNLPATNPKILWGLFLSVFLHVRSKYWDLIYEISTVISKYRIEWSRKGALRERLNHIVIYWNVRKIISRDDLLWMSNSHESALEKVTCRGRSQLDFPMR